MIPGALKARRQWVAWRAVPRGGKLTKVPMDPHTGRNASSTDSRTWGSFVDAQRAVGRFNATGLGFVFSADDLFAGVDLDGCRDPETGEIADWAQDIIGRLDSFTEVSPSGRGVHVIVRADKPEGRCRIDSIEMYDRGRFFCVTGEHIAGTPEFVEDRQTEIGAVFSDAFDGLRSTRTTARKSSEPDNTLEPTILGRAFGVILYRHDPRIFV